MENHKEVYEAVRDKIFRKAIEKVFGEVLLMGEHPGIKRLLEETINQIMKTEREIYLKGSPGNKGSPENQGFSGVKRRPMASTLVSFLKAPSALT
ncbi:MAG: hypothetical protein D6710_05665 [Nitrospirae bacterium]|nr:MAG: hypothetical protein D6710_05665 [Nitrospirota bacterium]